MWFVFETLEEGKAMYKLIALDIDGTLISNNGVVSAKTKRVINTAQAQGFLVTLNTGRNFHSAQKYAKELNINLPIIAANGTIIRDPNTLEIKHLINFKSNVAQKIAELLQTKKQIHSQAYHLDGILTTGVGLLGLVKFSNNHGNLSFKKFMEMVREYKRCNIRKTRDLQKAISKHKIHKFFVAATCEDSKALEKELEQFNCTVESHYEGKNGYLEIIPTKASKGEGLKKVAKLYNLTLEQTIAVGDSANDVSMFKVAGLPVAMANGTDYAKKHAKHITFTNSEDGVAAVIKEFMLTPAKDFKFIQKEAK